MRGLVSEYALVAPSSLADALALLASEPGRYRPFAGGTDLMVQLEAGALQHREFVNLWKLAELRGIEVSGDHVVFGALTTYAELRAHPVVQTDLPLLVEAARLTGAVAIQNRGTLGGNIANASPAADTPPALLVYGAQLELVSREGARWVDYASFHTGYKTTCLRAGELIARVRVPRHAGWSQCYRKVGTRAAQAISKVCFAGAARLQGDLVDEVRIAFGSVAPVPWRALVVEQELRGHGLDAARVRRARAALEASLNPIDDVRSTRAYRLEVAGNLLVRWLTQLAS